ncbi:cellulose biosynthesis cyclic di-GMP-binding regulatory protein BcsB [Caenimonas soli]|uniref:cellulose biosynthesis cyclic di-GMP-binding regulatory protein BcsB n=1 Tax=Caenimonas soli TaxID=2735555 RepID=UPI0015582C1D|nr:cellulose biosynthesis cyclic di-GMP-binding regulatory protein BcsB [Caenimonas soli]
MKLLRSVLLVTALLPGMAFAQSAGAMPPAAAASAASPAEVFRRMSSDTWVSRVVTLADIGITNPLVLGYPEATREIVLPVPPGVPFANGTLQMDASFVRADGGRTTLILSIDGFPVSARPVAAERGDGSLTLAVDGAPRSSGLVRFNLDWRTAIGRENTCSDTRTPGNLLRIEPTTRFTYRYDSSAVADLPAAWGSLPPSPMILIAGSKLSTDAYDSAWRLGVALERAGKRPRIVALPAVGDTVDLHAVVVPTGLRKVPAFAALAEGGKRRLKDLAEVGALMALGQGGLLQPDIVVADRATGSVLAQALDELRAQLPPESLDAFAEWRGKALDGWGRQLATGQVRLGNVFGRAAIVVAPDAGAQAAGLFTQSWHQATGTPSLTLNAADDPKVDFTAVSLKYLGAKPATLDVLSRADWNAGFDITAVTGEGRGPASLVIDVAAAPGAARTPPVVSVFLNDVLLGAREMEAHGRRERIVAPIPRHVLSTRNNIRVSFVRQQASDRCRETPESYPVSVLATSHMLLDKREPGPDFSGLISRYSDGVNLLVPIAYLYDSQNSLPRVISLAASTGVSPSRARFVAVADVGPPKLKGPFLAIDVELKDADKSEVKLEGGRLYLADGNDRPLLDVNGLGRAGLLEVTQVGRDTGAIYRTLSREAPPMGMPLQLSAGNVAVIGMSGLRAEINTTDPSGQDMVRETIPAPKARGHLWLPALLLIAAGAALLAYAFRMYQRKASKAGNGKSGG